MKTTITRFLKGLYNKNYDDYKIDYRNKLTLPSPLRGEGTNYLHQVLIGLLLSDGSLEKSSKTSLARLSVMFGSLHISYILHIYNLFEPYTDSMVNLITTFNKKTKINYLQVSFKTVSLPVLLIYHNMFYSFDNTSGRYLKIVPSPPVGARGLKILKN